MSNQLISNDIKLIEDYSILIEGRIVLYGAGVQGCKAYLRLKNRAGITATYFCDGSSSKWGKTVDGIKIISPEELKDFAKKEKVAIIVTPYNPMVVEQIVNNIMALELETNNVFTVAGLEVAINKNTDQPKTDKLREQAEKLHKLQVISLRREWFLESLLNCSTDAARSVLVYQPAKVGSTTIKASLPIVGIQSNNVHYLVYDMFEPEIREYSIALRNALKKLHPLKIITLVREPLSRSYSVFFDYLGTAGKYVYLNYLMQPGKSLAESCAEWMVKYKNISDGLTYYYEQEDNNLGYFNWFDAELKAAFDIDIFAHPFDRDKGFSIIRQANIEVLTIKLEKMNGLESVIGEFVDAPDFKLVNANEASSKAISALYKETREKIKIPKELVSLYYDNNPRMDHFYTTEEKIAFLKKWENNIAD